MSVLDGLLTAVMADPLAEDRWAVLCDWLEENEDPGRAELLRLHRRLLTTCCEPEKHADRAVWQARVVELLGQGVRPCVPHRSVLRSKRTRLEMVFAWVPPGSFLMGSPAGEEGRSEDESLHRVTLSRGFWLAVHPVTRAQWRRISGWTPNEQPSDDDRCPVRQVSWDDCQEFCHKLGRATGGRFRLPTEAEWEYTCRAGTTTPFFFGDVIPPGRADPGGEGPTPVGSFPPNAFGISDLYGDIEQWCQDWYGRYPTEAAVDPIGPDRGTERVVRGGCWSRFPEQSRSAVRKKGWSGGRSWARGCRVCLCLE